MKVAHDDFVLDDIAPLDRRDTLANRGDGFAFSLDISAEHVRDDG